MFFLFRRIRHSLVNSHRVGRYTFYAVGEILLVVVGILIALQVNMWREQVALKEKEVETLQLLLRDLKEEERQQRYFLDLLERQENNIIRLIANLDKNIEGDSLAILVGSARGGYNYRTSFPTYDGLKQSGELGIIRDIDVREKILRFHDFDMLYLNDLRNGYQNITRKTSETLFPYFGYVPKPEGGWSYVQSKGFEGLRQDISARNIIASNGRSRWWLHKRLNEIFIPQNLVLQELIEDYISRLSK